MIKTQFKPNTTVNQAVMDLPIIKHFSADQITSSVDKFRKGEKNLFWFLKLGAIVGTGVALWKWVLPPVFQMLGQLLALTATGVALVFLTLMAPVIFKGLRRLTRILHEAVIRHRPFEELAEQRQKLVENQQVFRVTKGNIKALENDMLIGAKKAEKDSVDHQNRLLVLHSKAKALKEDLENMIKNGGADARTSDDYVNGNAELQKIVSESGRVMGKLTQSKTFIQKYGSRAAIMRKVGQKLIMVETSMEIKIADFDATVEMLKNDYEFSQKSRAATDAAKSVMTFTNGWELEYALDVINSTIATDIAITAGNIKDIDALTSQYTLDSDELYANLDRIAENIKVGGDEIPSAKQYSNPEYKLTQDDKISSNGFDQLF